MITYHSVICHVKLGAYTRGPSDLLWIVIGGATLRLSTPLVNFCPDGVRLRQEHPFKCFQDLLRL